jgi:hypothetical protein
MMGEGRRPDRELRPCAPLIRYQIEAILIGRRFAPRRKYLIGITVDRDSIIIG